MAILSQICMFTRPGSRVPQWCPSLTILHGPGEAWEKDGPGAAQEVAAVVDGGLAFPAEVVDAPKHRSRSPRMC